jgi:tryptophanyl-tRNA synthetase
MTIPGIDGQKMSKSYNNVIDIFLPEKKLRKQVMSIVTDSTPLEQPKNCKSCNVFKLYELLASESQISELKTKYEGGNFGYGHAKQALFELILEHFSNERERFNYLMKNTDEIEAELLKGAEKARVIAQSVLQRVRKKVGY